MCLIVTLICLHNEVSLFRYHRGLEQWLARYFDLVEVAGSNPASATIIYKLHDYESIDIKY